MENVLKLLFLFGFIGLLFWTRSAKEDHSATKPGLQTVNIPLKTGDVVLRAGKGFISDMFRKTSLVERRYSHAGIVVMHEGRLMVAHIIQHAGSLGGIQVETITEFCNPRHNSGFSVYRYKCMNGVDSRLNAFVHEAVVARLPFDENFSLETDDSYYCSEFIYKAVLRTSGTALPVTEVKGMRYVAPDNLYINPVAHCVYSSFKNK